uniref:Aminopeptidase n=1 Tax=Hadrurus spadix TaxID=141984 RepID=A0A1W7RAL3_9SCOR
MSESNYQPLKNEMDSNYQAMACEEEESGENAKKQVLYGDGSIGERRRISCTKIQALSITVVIFIILLVIALIAAFARPATNCEYSEHLYTSLDGALIPLTTEPSSDELCPWQEIRLPSFIIPKHYLLFLHPNLTTFQNKGRVNITFVLEQDSDFVVLHSKDLNFTKFILLTNENELIPISHYVACNKHEQMYLQFQQSLKKKHEFTLVIEFTRKLEEKLEGFYISSYKTSAGEKRYLATTHFEATSARSAFPCFDEPAMKSTFQLSMVHSPEHNAYFNSELIQTVPYDNGLKLSEFKRTVQMSTYLVAFIVCDFKSTNRINEDGIMVRVLAPEEHLSRTYFALETASKILFYYHQFFNISYPLPKLDMIAVPDFGPGAMENWGLVTYRMTTILFNADESSAESQEHVATVIAHELAHQWFGNLVTMDWWSDLWLNEGFASFVEYLGANYVQPKWNMMDQFVHTTQDALAMDSLRSSHPIMAEVKDPEEIEAIFDAISYKKGAAIISMLENFLGMDILQSGLTMYLNKYRFKNAKTQDLWDTFTEVTTKFKRFNVSAIMDTWTRQKGFPLVTVICNKNTVSVNQTRFILSPAESDEASQQDLSPYSYKWYIPLTYITDVSSETKHYWLNAIEGSFDVPEEFLWLKVNVNQTGFYRVMYDEKMWDILIKLLMNDHTRLYPADRSSLLDDALTLARIGILKSHLALNLTLYLENELDYVPWETAILRFDDLDALMHESPGRLVFHSYIQSLLKPVLSSVKWEDNGPHLKKKLRLSVLTAAIKYGDPHTIEEAKKRFNEWMYIDKKIPPNLRSVVYSAGVKYGGKDEWDFCWNKYRKTQIPSEQRLLLTALGNTRDIWQISQYLNYSLNKDMIRPQDTTLVLAVIARNPIGRLPAWRFVRENWPTLLEMFGQGSFSMEAIILEVTSHFSTRFDYNEVKTFFSSVDVGAGAQALNQSLEKIRANIHWRENIEASVVQWLKEQIS